MLGIDDVNKFGFCTRRGNIDQADALFIQQNLSELLIDPRLDKIDLNDLGLVALKRMDRSDFDELGNRPQRIVF